MRTTVSRLLVALALLSILGDAARAQNEASDWTVAATLPMFATRFDDARTTTAFAAGAGFSFARHFKPSSDGRVRWLTLAAPVFARLDQAAPTEAALAGGLTIGTYNGLISVGVAGDLLSAGGRGLLRGRFAARDAMALVALNLNMGAGEPPQRTAGISAKRAGVVPDASPPPVYLGWGR